MCYFLFVQTSMDEEPRKGTKRSNVPVNNQCGGWAARLTKCRIHHRKPTFKQTWEHMLLLYGKKRFKMSKEIVYIDVIYAR
jgi:hypothetical protein